MQTKRTKYQGRRSGQSIEDAEADKAQRTQKWTKHRKNRSGQSTDRERVISSDDNGNSKSRCLAKIVSFFINNITGHIVIPCNLQLK